MRPVLLLTRPRRASEALAAEFAAEGWRPLVWPLLEIAPTGATPDLAGAQAVLLTSANAARLCPPAPLPALCVGEATAEAARAAGFADVRSAGADAEALAALAAESLAPQGGALVFPRGETVAGDLAGALRRAGFEVRESVVYRAEPAADAPPDVAAALRRGDVDVAAFYSPRTASVFARFAPRFAAGLARSRAVAISPSAAKALAGLGFAEVRAAPRPDGEAMRATLEAVRAAAV